MMQIAQFWILDSLKVAFGRDLHPHMYPGFWYWLRSIRDF